jgi:hypothetical protein
VWKIFLFATAALAALAADAIALGAGKESTASQTKAVSNSGLLNRSIAMFARRFALAPSRRSAIAITTTREPRRSAD